MTKLSTRCSVLAATNPKGSCSADGELDVNTGIASPLLSRFDLVLVLKDSHHQDWDRLVSKFILLGQNPLEEQEDTGFWSISRMRSYFLTIKALTPRLTEDAQRVLQEYYRCQRSVAQRVAARTTLRLLESLVRLSQGHARLMFREEVVVQDAVVAVALMEVSMQSSALVENVDALHTGFAVDPEKEYRNQAKIILTRLGLDDILKKELSRLTENSYPFPKTSDHSEVTVQDRSFSECVQATKEPPSGDSQSQCVIIDEHINDSSQKGYREQPRSQHHEASKTHGSVGSSRWVASSESHIGSRASKSTTEKRQSGSRKAQGNAVGIDEDGLEDLENECSTGCRNSLREHCAAQKTKKRSLKPNQGEEASEDRAVLFAKKVSDVSPKSDAHKDVDIAKLLKSFVRKPRNHASTCETKSSPGTESCAENKLRIVGQPLEQGEEHPTTLSGDSSKGDKSTLSQRNSSKPSQQSVADYVQQKTTGDVSISRKEARDCTSSEKAPKQCPSTPLSSAQEKLKRFALVKSPEASPRSTSLKAVANGDVPLSSSSTNATSLSDLSSLSRFIHSTPPSFIQSKPSTQEATTKHTLGIVTDDELGLSDNDWMFDSAPCEKRRRTAKQ